MTSENDWQPYFAILPVWVDAYDESERKNGEFRYRKIGWVERQFYTWTDDEEGETYSGWKYRLARGKS